MPQAALLGFDHIDARVPSLASAEPFYDRLMPLFGFTRKNYVMVRGDDWQNVTAGDAHNGVEYIESAIAGRTAAFIGIIEDATMTPTRTRIAFRVAVDSDYVRWQSVLIEAGAQRVELSEDMHAYPAIFFEDPCGTKLEICGRSPSP